MYTKRLIDMKNEKKELTYKCKNLCCELGEASFRIYRLYDFPNTEYNDVYTEMLRKILLEWKKDEFKRENYNKLENFSQFPQDGSSECLDLVMDDLIEIDRIFTDIVEFQKTLDAYERAYIRLKFLESYILF
jgi:hypothetical protein